MKIKQESGRCFSLLSVPRGGCASGRLDHKREIRLFDNCCPHWQPKTFKISNFVKAFRGLFQRKGAAKRLVGLASEANLDMGPKT